MSECEYKFSMWVVKMGNFQKSAKNEIDKTCEKLLYLTKYIAKEIKQDKIEPYKHHSPQKNGIYIMFCKEGYIKLARNNNRYSFTNKFNINNPKIIFQTN